jgi:hypothetical protein
MDVDAVFISTMDFCAPARRLALAFPQARRSRRRGRALPDAEPGILRGRGGRGRDRGGRAGHAAPRGRPRPRPPGAAVSRRSSRRPLRPPGAPLRPRRDRLRDDDALRGDPRLPLRVLLLRAVRHPAPLPAAPDPERAPRPARDPFRLELAPAALARLLGQQPGLGPRVLPRAVRSPRPPPARVGHADLHRHRDPGVGAADGPLGLPLRLHRPRASPRTACAARTSGRTRSRVSPAPAAPPRQRRPRDEPVLLGLDRTRWNTSRPARPRRPRGRGRARVLLRRAHRGTDLHRRLRAEGRLLGETSWMDSTACI